MVSSVDIEISRLPGLLRVTLRGVVGPLAVRQLRARLDELVVPDPAPLMELEIDLSAVDLCDCRLLPVLDALRRRLQQTRGRLEVLGLDPQVLSGFAEAGMGDLLAAYRASLAMARPHWPKEPGWARAATRFSDSERRLIAFAAALAAHDATAGVAVAERTVEWCARAIGVRVAVVLVTGDRAAGGVAVMCATDEGARLVSVVGIRTGEGPVVECLQRGEPVGAPDLGAADLTGPEGRWPRYSDVARRHDVHAVRVLPVRVPEPAGPGLSATIGALVLLSGTAGAMAPTDLQVLEAVASLAGTALARDTAYSRGVPPYRSASPVACPTARTDQVEFERAVGVLVERGQLTPPQAEARLTRLAAERGVDLAECARLVVADGAGVDHTGGPGISGDGPCRTAAPASSAT